MKINFTGNLKELKDGIEIFSKNYGFELNTKGFPVKVERLAKGIEVSSDGKKGVIKYAKKIHFFRGLGLWLEAFAKKKNFRIKEKPQFTMNAVMPDVSNNGVLKVEMVKRMIELMAAMGLDTLMLYMKDTYEIKSLPYFGYMRGRYTQEELRECDDYACIFGIEMIPSIQTLAHLDTAMKWKYAFNIKDNPDILLVGEEETYQFAEKMIRAASAPFRSKRIHLGMDEAQGLGLGKYLLKHGYRNRFDIMNEHLGRVRQICDRHGLKPMIWSDMFFRLASKTNGYYDMEAKVPETVIKKVPKGVELVFWDYYHTEEKVYRHFLKEHKRFNNDIIFAGGVWTWRGMNMDYNMTFASTNPALAACKKEGIKQVIATLWGDNGTETNVFGAILGMQLFAEHGYSEKVNDEKVKQRFRFCAGADFDAFYDLTFMDELSGDKNKISGSTPAKIFLWQDILTGLFDKHAENRNLSALYSKLSEKFRKHAAKAGKWRFIFDFPAKLADVISLKAEIGLKIRRMYEKHDLKGLKKTAEKELPELYKKVNNLRLEHRKQWMLTYKAFGWEILDIRYGGVLARIDSAIDRIKDYLKGAVDKIEELQEERLYFDGPREKNYNEIGACNRYHKIVTAGYLSGNYKQQW